MFSWYFLSISFPYFIYILWNLSAWKVKFVLFADFSSIAIAPSFLFSLNLCSVKIPAFLPEAAFG